MADADALHSSALFALDLRAKRGLPTFRLDRESTTVRSSLTVSSNKEKGNFKREEDPKMTIFKHFAIAATASRLVYLHIGVRTTLS